MERDGHLKTLAERMKEKAEQERMQTEAIFTEQLQTLKNSLQESSQNALRTMSDAMAQEITNAAENLNQRYRLLSMAFAKKWIVLASLGAALCLGMLAGGWALAKAGAWNLEKYRSELAQLKQDCQTQRDEQEQTAKVVEILNRTLTTLMDKTSGVFLMERDGSRFLVAPMGSESGHIFKGRPAIKLKE